MAHISGYFELVLESQRKKIPLCRHYYIWDNFGWFSFYAPNFEEVEGAYWFGPVRPSVRLSVSPSVRLSVCLSVTLFGSSETQEPLMLESWNFIYGIYMKNKRTRIFFFLHRSCRSGVMPLFRLCMNNLVSRISEKPLRLGSWYLAYSYRPRCRWTD